MACADSQNARWLAWLAQSSLLDCREQRTAYAQFGVQPAEPLSGSPHRLVMVVTMARDG